MVLECAVRHQCSTGVPSEPRLDGYRRSCQSLNVWLKWCLVGPVVGVLLAACSTDTEALHEDCWQGYGDPEAAHGFVEIGARSSSKEEFEPFEGSPGIIRLQRGGQGGTHASFSVRAQGLKPGTDSNGADVPSTIFHLVLEDGTVIGGSSCAFRQPYIPAGDSIVLLAGGRVIVDPDYLPYAYGRTLRLIVEILDCDGSYAYAEQPVTLHSPHSPDGLERQRALVLEKPTPKLVAD